MMTPVGSPPALIGPMAAPDGLAPPGRARVRFRARRVLVSAAEGPVMVKLEVARVLDLARDGEVHRVFQQLRVNACLCRCFALPVGAWECLRPRHHWQHQYRAYYKSPDPNPHDALLRDWSQFRSRVPVPIA